MKDEPEKCDICGDRYAKYIACYQIGKARIFTVAEAETGDQVHARSVEVDWGNPTSGQSIEEMEENHTHFCEKCYESRKANLEQNCGRTEWWPDLLVGKYVEVR